MVRQFLLLLAALFLTACSNGVQTSAQFGDPLGESQSANAGFLTNSSNPIDPIVDGESLTACIDAKSALGGTVPSLTSALVQRHAAMEKDARMVIGVDDIKAYAAAMVEVSGGDGKVAAELITYHETTDQNCFQEQIEMQQAKSDSTPILAAMSAKNRARKNRIATLKRTRKSLLEVYKTVKQMVSTGDYDDISNRLARHYRPITIDLPATYL